MRASFIAGAALLLCTAASAQEAPSPARLKADVDALVGFGTRHTLSSGTDPRRGIGAARRWFGDEMRRIGRRATAGAADRLGRAPPSAPDAVRRTFT